MAETRPERWYTSPTDGRTDYLTAPDGARIRYGIWPAAASAASRGTALLLPGRTEFIEKYFEPIRELADRGFHVVTLDWRGQGLSSRPTDNPSKDHVTSFRPRLDDLGRLVDEVVLSDCPRPLSIVAHSMGGHLALHYLHDHPGLVKQAVLLSPMIGIYFGRMPETFVRAVVGVACRASLGESYALGRTDYGRYQKSDLWRDMLTSDPGRFMVEHHMIAETPALALGGVSYAWLKAAFGSIDRLFLPGYAEEIATPMLIAMAGKERVVDNRRIERLARRLPDCELIEIAGARHELLKESDQFRRQLWAAFDRFMGIV